MTAEGTLEIRDLIVVSENSGRALMGHLPDPIINEDGLVVLECPLMFAEQKQMDPQSGGMQIQIMMMPILFSEYVPRLYILPASWYILPAHSKLAIEYRMRWDEYESTLRAASAGIITARSIPKGPVLVPPNGRP